MLFKNKTYNSGLIILYYFIIFYGGYSAIAQIFPDLPFAIDISYAKLAILMLVFPPAILIYLSVKWYGSLKRTVGPDDKTLRSIKLIPIVYSLTLALLFWLFLKDNARSLAQIIYSVALIISLITGMRVTRKLEYNYATQLISCFYIFLSTAVIHTLVSLFILAIISIGNNGFELWSMLESVMSSVPIIITIFISILVAGSIQAPIIALFRAKKKREADDSLIDDSSFG